MPRRSRSTAARRETAAPASAKRTSASPPRQWSRSPRPHRVRYQPAGTCWIPREPQRLPHARHHWRSAHGRRRGRESRAGAGLITARQHHRRNHAARQQEGEVGAELASSERREHGTPDPDDPDEQEERAQGSGVRGHREIAHERQHAGERLRHGLARPRDPEAPLDSSGTPPPPEPTSTANVDRQALLAFLTSRLRPDALAGRLGPRRPALTNHALPDRVRVGGGTSPRRAGADRGGSGVRTRTSSGEPG